MTPIFGQKEKEPKLSERMQSIIEKSQGFGDGESYDQIIRYKYEIMKRLTSNSDIIRTLHNEDLESKITDWENPNGSIYEGVNVFDFLKIPGIQSDVKNFICFEVHELETIKYNDELMNYQVMFRSVSHEDDFTTDWGIARQDLLAAIIKNDFDWTNDFGMHFVKSSDVGKVFENGYYYRQFTYEIESPNASQNKLRNGGGYLGRG